MEGPFLYLIAGPFLYLILYPRPVFLYKNSYTIVFLRCDLYHLLSHLLKITFDIFVRSGRLCFEPVFFFQVFLILSLSQTSGEKTFPRVKVCKTLSTTSVVETKTDTVKAHARDKMDSCSPI